MRIEESIGEKRTVSRERKDAGSVLFFLCFIPLLMSLTLRTTVLPYAQSDALWTFNYVLTIVVCVAMTAKVLFLDTYRDTTAKLLIMLMLVLVFCQSAFLVLSWELSTVFALCVGSFGVDLKKIYKVYLVESSAILFVALILSLTGAIPNLPFEKFGRIRYALGTIYCTDFSARVFYLLLLFLLLFHTRLKIPHLLLLAGLSFAVFVPTFGKLDFACSILALILFGMHMYVRSHEDSATAVWWKKAWPKIGLLSMPVASVVMFFLSYFFSPDNRFTSFVDQVITGRLALGKNGFSEFGVTVLGHSVVYRGAYVTENYNFVDCSYLNMLFKEGVIAVLVVIAVYVLIAKKHKDHLPVMYILAMVSLNCMLEHHIIDMAYNPFMLLLLADTGAIFGSGRTVPGEQEKKGPGGSETGHEKMT
ncbi:MAG: hypothetical protein IK020_04680 [Clostridiales bacterium]|nr:hypothetical protein [Clostridiales bacterium]